MLFAIFGVMLVSALAAVLIPLYRQEGGLSPRWAGIAVAVAAVAIVTYYQTGSPDARFSNVGPDSIEAMVESLAVRLAENPDDVDGWKMLGRSYSVMGRFEDAVGALEKAVALENSSDGQTLADLGEAVFLADNTTLNGRAGQLFENALALNPGNSKALFYSGLGAAGRGDTALAAERWEKLLATSPPPEVEQVLKARIAEWRGEAPQPAELADAGAGNLQLEVDVALGQDVSGLAPETTVFVIARDPSQPAPPVAVARRQLGELPARVTLTDADAMIPGRPLSAFSRIEIVVRASASGQPMEQPGDWYGSATFDVAETRSVSITVDQQVR